MNMKGEGHVIESERLLLRRWREEDREPFYRLNSDARVMEFFPECLTRAQSDSLVERINDHFREARVWIVRGGVTRGPNIYWVRGTGGAVFNAHFTPCVEIGWRLAADYWGRGFATEGARAVVKYAFEQLALDALVSFTVPENIRSRRVMEKIGMTRDASDDFDHPNVAEGHPLRRHVLYRLQSKARRYTRKVV